eukprot:271882_1
MSQSKYHDVNDTNYVYQFDNINDVHFIVPFEMHTNKVNIYVQVEKHSDFVFLRTFIIKDRTHHSKDRVDYVLQILQMLNYPINNINNFFGKMGCNVTNRDVSLMTLNDKLCKQVAYHPFKTVLERLYVELKIDQLSTHYRVLTSKFKIQVYSSFNCFCPVADDQDQKYNIEENTEFKIVDDETKSQIEFTKNEQIVIKDNNLRDKSYTIYVRNVTLFTNDKYILLQNINKIVFKDCTGHLNFANALEKHDDMLINFNINLNRDVLNEYYEEVLTAKFALVCDTAEKEIIADKIYGNYYIYQFARMEDICFVIPFKNKVNKNKPSKIKFNAVNVYVQVQPKSNFLFIKSFDIGDQIDKNNRKNQIDFLLRIVKMYPMRITNAQNFYDKIGVALNENDISIIKKNSIIYEQSKFDQIVLEHLVKDLKINRLSKL